MLCGFAPLILAAALLADEEKSSGAGSIGKTENPRSSRIHAPKRIDINQASIEELKTLPGIGESTARRILEYRRKNPPFRRVEELLIIRGISRNRLDRIRDRICVQCSSVEEGPRRC